MGLIDALARTFYRNCKCQGVDYRSKKIRFCPFCKRVMGTSFSHCPYCGVKLQKPGFDEFGWCPSCDNWTLEKTFSLELVISFKTLEAELERWVISRHCLHCDAGYIPVHKPPSQYFEVKHSLECPCTASLEEIFLIALGIPYNPNTVAQGVKLWVQCDNGELIPIMDKTVRVGGRGTPRKEQWDDTFTIIESDITVSRERLIVLSPTNGNIAWKGSKVEISVS